MINSFQIGQRVYFRPVERADAPLLVSWINNPVVWRTLRCHRPMNLQTEEAFIDKIKDSEQDVVFLIVARENDLPLGMTGLHKIDTRHRHAEFGILLGDPDQWGQGYGTESTRMIVRYGFETLNLHRIYLHVHEDNTLGLRAYEKAGFRKEGVLRQEAFREGRYWDTVVMGVLREEWSQPT